MTRRTMTAIIAGGLAALALLAVAWFTLLAPKLDEEAAIDLGHGDYALQGTDGQPFTEDTLRGAPTAVFFGFAHCPEVCPTTLGDIELWQAELAEAGEAPLRTYFVTVDPERDTVEMMADYVGWVPGVVGVSGSREEIDKAIRAFRVFAAEVPLEGGDYTMDHSAFVLLFDDRGNFFEPIRYQEEFESAMAKIRRVMAM
ncbi:SCO family protein [Vannielia litorea]|uniref:SCO family protein n=1 Tax=Vannielia litorea TaxID=1217970 RepID=UPI001C985902|nr:SCO family protein [Vannielia litorea]MBY6155240.1 SCO family protein [Vannielia litorea]